MTLVILCAGFYSGSANIANSTRFGSIGGFFNPSGLTESDNQTIIRETGTFSNLYVRLVTNTCSAATTFTLLDSGTAKTEIISVATTLTGEFEDITHSDATVAGDKYDIQILPAGGSTGTITATVIRMLYATTTNTASRMIAFSSTAHTATSVTYYVPISGLYGSLQTTEAVCKCRQRLAGTMKSLMVNASANTRTIAVTVNSRLNGANGTLTKSITALTTGFFEDTVDSDTVAIGDDYNYAFTLGSDASTSITMRNMATTFVNTAGYFQNVCALDGGRAWLTTTAQYNPLSGDVQQASGAETESRVQMKAGSSLQFSNLTIVISTNTSGSPGTLNFRKNAINGNMTKSITASTTGTYTDTINKDYVVSSDEINSAFSAGTASGTTVGSISVLGVTGTNAPLTETTTISETPKRLIGRQASTIFPHTN